MTENVFNADSSNTPVDTSNVTLETLVGENQKYKTPDDLAKAYANADAYIETIKAELIELRTKAQVLEDFKNLQPQNSNVETPPRQDPPVVDPQPKNDDKDFKTLLREELAEAEKERKFAENINSVSEKLAERFGSGNKANEFIRQKSQELNVSVDFLMDVAGKSPQALYKTLGLDTQPSQNSPNASMADRVNTAAFQRDKGSRNFRYYEELRKTDPKAYYQTQIQQQMFNDRRTQGESFYNS